MALDALVTKAAEELRELASLSPDVLPKRKRLYRKRHLCWGRQHIKEIARKYPKDYYFIVFSIVDARTACAQHLRLMAVKKGKIARLPPRSFIVHEFRTYEEAKLFIIDCIKGEMSILRKMWRSVREDNRAYVGDDPKDICKAEDERAGQSGDVNTGHVLDGPKPQVSLGVDKGDSGQCCGSIVEGESVTSGDGDNEGNDNERVATDSAKQENP